jgi:hypothetical protein
MPCIRTLYSRFHSLVLTANTDAISRYASGYTRRRPFCVHTTAIGKNEPSFCAAPALPNEPTNAPAVPNEPTGAATLPNEPTSSAQPNEANLAQIPNEPTATGTLPNEPTAAATALPNEPTAAATALPNEPTAIYQTNPPR